jgi:hypothetical protein
VGFLVRSRVWEKKLTTKKILGVGVIYDLVQDSSRWGAKSRKSGDDIVIVWKEIQRLASHRKWLIAAGRRSIHDSDARA